MTLNTLANASQSLESLIMPTRLILNATEPAPVVEPPTKEPETPIREPVVPAQEPDPGTHPCEDPDESTCPMPRGDF
jgi:hypothetical protein